MEHQLWKAIVAVLRTLVKTPTRARFTFSDVDVVLVHFWAVLHDRPARWACVRAHWPIHRRRQPLPSPSTLSRRLRSPSVMALLAALEQRVIAPPAPGLFWIIDGKPLPVGGCTKDRQARYGRAAGGYAKGYKLHALLSGAGGIVAWRIAPMNKDERFMATRLLKEAPIQGYVVADGNYDSNTLHELCRARGNLQLVTSRRCGPGRGLGHHRQSAGRLRAMALLENPFPQFGQHLLQERECIERAFAHLTNWSSGLTGMPPWVRTHRRVHRWVQAKLILTALKRLTHATTYVK